MLTAGLVTSAKYVASLYGLVKSTTTTLCRTNSEARQRWKIASAFVSAAIKRKRERMSAASPRPSAKSAGTSEFARGLAFLDRATANGRKQSTAA